MKSAYDGAGGANFKSSYRKAETAANKNPLTKTKSIVANAGIPTEAYFRNYHSNGTLKDGLWSVLRTDIPTNYPPAPTTREALWSPGQAHKGMFLKYKSPGGINLDDAIAAKADPAKVVESNIFYGFQFHYNPTSVGMTYGGIPEVDVAMYTSGTEAFNALGVGVSQSTITFNMLINRVFDMKYYNAQTGYLKDGVSSSQFAGRFPTPQEQREIYNKGTMYDIEFFLRTIMGGVTMNSYLGRNAWDKKTSDMGFLTGIPVELHLGKSMRYLGRVEGFSINHVLFTERMVPTFTEVSVTLTRIPDHALNTLANPNSSSAKVEKPDTTSTDWNFATPAPRSGDYANNVFEMVGP